jgi:hypothetical protein
MGGLNTAHFSFTMKNFYRTSLYCIFVLAILVGSLFVFLPIITSLKDPSVDPLSNTLLGSTDSFEITFPDRESVESRLFFDPIQSYNLIWKDKKAVIQPKIAFSTGNQIVLHLKSGAMSLDGRKYTREFSWVYPIRQPGIVYLGNVTTSPEIWVFPA